MASWCAITATPCPLAVVKPLAFLGKPILTHQLERALSGCCRDLGKVAE